MSTRGSGDPSELDVCLAGASGKLGLYMVQHCLDRGYEVVAVILFLLGIVAVVVMFVVK